MKALDQLEVEEYIKDEYGNFYEIMRTKTELGKLTEVKLSNAYFEVSFQSTMDLQECEKEKYGRGLIGVYLQDIINSGIQHTLDEYGKVYSIQELKSAGVNVVFIDTTKRHL